MAKGAGGQMGFVAALVRSALLVHPVYAESSRECGITAQRGQPSGAQY
ncbi:MULTISPECIES: hypothetical protein [Streptomyces]|jgi:hypothetical protein|nr:MULTISPECIES: hypothetical protein [Streptomyces]SOE32949.1 hypothetical protein SAMN05442782_9952 [Streptomyces sp. OK228]